MLTRTETWGCTSLLAPHDMISIAEGQNSSSVPRSSKDLTPAVHHESTDSFQRSGNCRRISSEVLSGTYLEDVNRDPLTEPKQDKPTKTGMIQDMTPRW